MSQPKVVIFDVDGTLYNQAKLRKKMLFSLLSFYALRPWRYKELIILQTFRREREKRIGNVGTDLENAQYEWCSRKTKTSVDKIKKVVDHWIFTHPNPFLASFIYPGVKNLFNELRARGIKIAIYSDYKAEDKMIAMGLEADLIVSSTDSYIDRFKPDPAAINFIMDKFNVTAQDCLFIGDREELDGQCAVNAGVPYLILNKGDDPESFFNNIQNRLIL